MAFTRLKLLRSSKTAFYLVDDQSIVYLIHLDLILDLLSLFVIDNPPILNGEVVRVVKGSLFKRDLKRE